MADVNTNPITNPMRLGGNQREAKRITLKKQKALPIPVKKRKKQAKENVLVRENAPVPIMQIANAVKITRRVAHRSSNNPATNKKITLAIK